MSLNKHFKDTYVSLSNRLVSIGQSTILECENPVIHSLLSSLFLQNVSPVVEKIQFLPLTDCERKKIRELFGSTRKETDEAYLLAITEKEISVFSNSPRGHLYGACTLWEHY